MHSFFEDKFFAYRQNIKNLEGGFNILNIHDKLNFNLNENFNDSLKPESEYREPETNRDMHRPKGSPHSREVKSQKVQLNSAHHHATNKDVKMDMHAKTGLKEGVTKRSH